MIAESLQLSLQPLFDYGEIIHKPCHFLEIR